MIENLLSLVIITYNRADLLKHTLETIFEGPLKNVPLTVLNNASTDHTVDVCMVYADRPNFRLVTNKFNIGADANIMRAYECADNPYVWVMSDDDEYDFSRIDDVVDAMASGKYDSIHIGAFPFGTERNFRGRAGCIKDYIAEGYDYFRIVSNNASTIVRTQSVREMAIAGYQNIVNHYPHMPFFISQFNKNAEIYISGNVMVNVVLGYQNYSLYDFYKWWVGTSALVKGRKNRRNFIMSQFHTAKSKILAGCYLSFLKKRNPSWHTISKLWWAMPWKNRLGSIFIIPWRYFEVKRDIRKAAKQGD